MSTSEVPNPDRERLKTFFTLPNDTDVCRRWDDLWKEGTFLPFDRHVPNPALHEVLEKHTSPSQTPTAGRHLGSPLKENDSTMSAFAGRKTALVPGCGRGYDVLLLAAYGYHAIGLEISETAVRACEVLKGEVERGLAGESVGEALREDVLEQYRTKNESIGRGTATFVTGDFFAGPWMKDGSRINLPERFDLVYDYTFLSAFPVSLRPRWAARMRDLVEPDGGRLVCVEFPTYKEPKTGGPPWALPSVVYVAHLSMPGRELGYDEEGRVVISDEDKAIVEKGEGLAADGMVRLAHWKAEKTHEIGKGTDHVGIWKRADGS